jgi:hypothetical protein
VTAWGVSLLLQDAVPQVAQDVTSSACLFRRRKTSLWRRGDDTLGGLRDWRAVERFSVGLKLRHRPASCGNDFECELLVYLVGRALVPRFPAGCRRAEPLAAVLPRSRAVAGVRCRAMVLHVGLCKPTEQRHIGRLTEKRRAKRPTSQRQIDVAVLR